jgi:hypothetical protein
MIGVDYPASKIMSRQQPQVRHTESESLLIGRNFGVVTNIETAPNGNLFLVSLR